MPMSLKSIIFALVVMGILAIVYAVTKVFGYLQKTEFQKSLGKPKASKHNDGNNEDDADK